ncbi:hypothetical protein PC129_g25254, partial [Phytophthora cactorum]
MPLSFKDRDGRLKAFARNKSDSNIGQTNDVQLQVSEKRADQPLQAPIPTQQMENIRALIPVNRYSAPPRENGFLRPSLRSPQLPPQLPPPNNQPQGNSDDRRRELFSGSQPGESFMNSGPTTP